MKKKLPSVESISDEDTTEIARLLGEGYKIAAVIPGYSGQKWDSDAYEYRHFLYHSRVLLVKQ